MSASTHLAAGKKRGSFLRLLSLIVSLVLLPSTIPMRMGLVSAVQLSSSLGLAVSSEQNPKQESPKQDPQKAEVQKPDTQKKEEQDEVIRLSSRLVLVPVSATDAAGKPVRDLTADDFIIEEEGRPQKVIALGEPGKTPVDIAILFDVSGSIQGQFAFEQQAAVRFVKEVLKPSDAISIFAIGTKPRLVRARTTNSEEAIQGLTSIEPAKEATAFFDSVAEAALYLGQVGDPGSRHVLVVISDGEENYSSVYGLSDAIRELQKNDCLFYSLNPSGASISLNIVSQKGQGYMEAMSNQTGGKSFLPEKIESLGAVFRQIAEELQAQYLFGYYSTDEHSEGGFRHISVRTPKRPDLRVRARQGYYASATRASR
jgi:Ca-activated chloride channel family protein